MSECRLSALESRIAFSLIVFGDNSLQGPATAEMAAQVAKMPLTTVRAASIL